MKSAYVVLLQLLFICSAYTASQQLFRHNPEDFNRGSHAQFSFTPKDVHDLNISGLAYVQSSTELVPTLFGNFYGHGPAFYTATLYLNGLREAVTFSFTVPAEEELHQEAVVNETTRDYYVFGSERNTTADIVIKGSSLSLTTDKGTYLLEYYRDWSAFNMLLWVGACCAVLVITPSRVGWRGRHLIHEWMRIMLAAKVLALLGYALITAVVVLRPFAAIFMGVFFALCWMMTLLVANRALTEQDYAKTLELPAAFKLLAMFTLELFLFGEIWTATLSSFVMLVLQISQKYSALTRDQYAQMQDRRVAMIYFLWLASHLTHMITPSNFFRLQPTETGDLMLLVCTSAVMKVLLRLKTKFKRAADKVEPKEQEQEGDVAVPLKKQSSSRQAKRRRVPRP